MSYVITRSVFLAINSVPLATPAWELLNPMDLRQALATRGQDLIIPGAVGVVANRRRRAEMRLPLEIVVSGATKWDGTAHPSPAEGIDLNLMHLRDNVTDPPASPYTGVLTIPSGSTVSGLIHVESFEWHYEGYDAVGTIDVTIPLGALA